MKKLIFLTALSTMSIATPSFASSILDSLNQQGVSVEAMSDKALDEARGAALITGQPFPSVTHGLRTHMVKWKKFGSKSDYMTYNWMGSFDNTDDHTAPLAYTYNGIQYHVGGDIWKADDITAGSGWTNANSYVKEYHYQVLDYPSDTATIYAFRETAWNRPISTFSW